MARNGSGTYNLLTNSWNPATNGVSATAVDWQNLINDVAAALTQSLSADGQTPITGNLNAGNNKITGLAAGSATGDSLRWEQLFSQGQPANLASAATTDIGAQNTVLLNITGTTTITSFGTNYNGPRYLRFDGALTLTHNATTLILPGGANITTAAGDSLIAVPVGSPATGWRVAAYQLGAVVPGSIPDESVTFAKLQNIATSRLLGRATAGTGDVEQLTAVPAGVSVPAEGLTGNIAEARITTALNATGSAPLYACRAWVNFDGTGTVGLRGSGNVSSITDNGTGDYTVNFTASMPDVYYAKNIICQGIAGNNQVITLPDFGPSGTLSAPTASSFRFMVVTPGTGFIDSGVCNVSIFR